jgi:hypothetical protein
VLFLLVELVAPSLGAQDHVQRSYVITPLRGERRDAGLQLRGSAVLALLRARAR